MTVVDQPTSDQLERPSLTATVKYYERHIFICSGRTGWPAHIDQDGGFAQQLTEALANHVVTNPRKVKITACDEPSLSEDGFDLLLFPERIRLLGLKEADVPLIAEHLMGDRPSRHLPYRPLEERYVFVCVHGQRDERCGACGPPLVARFQAELAGRGLTDAILVRQTSHLGGHVYAGNVIFYPGGDWYGYVTPDHVPELIDRHLLGGRLVGELWRGRMGLSTADQLATLASDH